MSAWLVSDRHVDLVVTAMIGLDVIEAADADRVGDLLWQENVRSLRARYTRAALMWELPTPGDYRFVPAPDENLAGVCVAAHSYRYQSGEYGGFESSEAARLIQALLDAAALRLGLADLPSSERYTRIRRMAGDVHRGGYWSVPSRADVATA